MKKVKQLLSYFIWTIISFLAAFGYMRIILGPKPKPAKGILKMFDWVYETAMIQVGSIIGLIIACIFILLDVFYLRKKLQHKPYSILTRFLILLAIATVVGATHYILEKVVDVI